MSKEQEERGLSTADLAARAEAPLPRTERVAEVAPQRRGQRPGDDSVRTAEEVRVEDVPVQQSGQQVEPLAALFAPEVAGDFQSRWDAVQIGFVDDPGEAVRRADELVAQVMKSLAESFASERERIESQLGQTDSESTENMRLALRRYRSFFQRLLAL